MSEKHERSCVGMVLRGAVLRGAVRRGEGGCLRKGLTFRVVCAPLPPTTSLFYPLVVPFSCFSSSLGVLLACVRVFACSRMCV